MNISAETLNNSPEAERYQLSGELLQPWSTPVLKTTLPVPILRAMLSITDSLIEDSATESHGDSLVGQIDTELKIPLDILESFGVRQFLEGAVKEFVIACKCQEHPFKNALVRSALWKTNVTSCWIVSQQPNEYNPVHTHHDDVSAVMYLRVPEMEPSRKASQDKDGCIEFLGIGSQNRQLSCSQFFVAPNVGDLLIFGSRQAHTVYPYRCPAGQEETERRSVSFNARFWSEG